MTPSSGDEFDDPQRLAEIARTQIAGEIHDGLIPLLYVSFQTIDQRLRKLDDADHDLDISVNVDTVDELRKVRDWIAEAMRLGRQLLSESYLPDFQTSDWFHEARSLIERMHPDDDRLNWKDQLQPPQSGRSLREREQSESGRTLRERDPGSTASVATAAFRIVVESVRNALRHSGADRIDVTRQVVDTGWQVVILDNGHGFDAGSLPPDRYGIRGMRLRAQSAGLDFDLSSRPGGPTMITIRT